MYQHRKVRKVIDRLILFTKIWNEIPVLFNPIRRRIIHRYLYHRIKKDIFVASKSMKMDKQETKNIIKGLSQYGKRAYNNALKEDGYAIVLKGNNICRINADGTTNILKDIGKTKVKISQRNFSIK